MNSIQITTPEDMKKYAGKCYIPIVNIQANGDCFIWNSDKA